METAIESVTDQPVLPVEGQEPLDQESVSSHRAQFGPEAQRAAQAPIEEQPETERPQERHRAKSQKATADDYQEIASLTKTLREKEAELTKAKPDAMNGSPRLLTLKRQIKAIDSELSDLQPKVPAPAARVEPTTARPSAASTFTEAEPTMEQFQNEADPYASWNRALARFDRRKEDWDATQAAQTQRQQAEQRVEHEQDQAAIQAYGTRLATFKQSRPDFDQKLAAVGDRPLPALLVQAIVRDDNGPALLYSLLSDPVLLDEMHLLSDGKAVTESSVALLRRRLNAQLTRPSAAVTGSATASAPRSWTSRPPNPVRTSPLTTGDDPPGDGHSVSEHRRHYSPKRR